LADEGEGRDLNSKIFSISDSPNEIGHVNRVIQAGFTNKVHFFFPGDVQGDPSEADPEGTHPMGRDPSLIYDFKGVIGGADLTMIHGTGTDLNTGASARYTFHTDTRFMSGEFIGSDGRKHEGTFAFIWLDSEVPGPLGPHSYDPGISRNGVLWTTAIPESSVDFQFGEGEADLRLRNVPVLDAFTVPNSLDGDRPGSPPFVAPGTPPVSAIIDSLHIHWSGVTRTTTFASTDPMDRFAGTFKETGSTITVTATTPRQTGHGFRFVSDSNTGVSGFAQIGIERNGRLL
jgi:hypothetical protein